MVLMESSTLVNVHEHANVLMCDEDEPILKVARRRLILFPIRYPDVCIPSYSQKLTLY